MRNYYYCEANFSVYTEREMRCSCFSDDRYEKNRFMFIGSFKNRHDAEATLLKKFNLMASDAKRI